MPVVAIVGAQWGDEGKGKIVDLCASHADLVVRYGGGANAGHTLVVDGKKVVLHLVPSGALHASTRCLIAQGTVVDPIVLLEELALLAGQGLGGADRILVADRAHVVLPHHMRIDALREEGKSAIGTTRRGIGPAYEDKVARRGVRMGDLLRPAVLRARLEANLEAWDPTIRALGGELPSLEATERDLKAQGEKLASFIVDGGSLVRGEVSRGAKVLLEGAQGAMLDLDHGTYPYVTSSTVLAAGACAGAGLPPSAIDRVIGVTKAYATRVGGGPFPSELDAADGDRLREAGSEFGATTGRPRRCGWLDLVALRYAVALNGIERLALTKLDVLGGMGDVQLCTAYELDGARLDTLPYDGLGDVAPLLETAPGWGDVHQCEDVEALPETARQYIERIEAQVGCEVGVVSVGPDRQQTLGPTDPFAN